MNNDNNNNNSNNNISDKDVTMKIDFGSIKSLRIVSETMPDWGGHDIYDGVDNPIHKDIENGLKLIIVLKKPMDEEAEYEMLEDDSEQEEYN